MKLCTLMIMMNCGCVAVPLVAPIKAPSQEHLLFLLCHVSRRFAAHLPQPVIQLGLKLIKLLVCKAQWGPVIVTYNNKLLFQPPNKHSRYALFKQTFFPFGITFLVISTSYSFFPPRRCDTVTFLWM